MKATSTICRVTLAALLSYATAFAQSHFLFRNRDSGGPIPVDAPVLDAQGVPLAGANYLAELWGAATPDSLTPLVLLDQGGQRLIKPFASRGYVDPIDGGFLAVTSVPPSGWAWLQMRAWDARLGATYEEVVARGLGGNGESPLFYAQGGNPFDQFPEPGRLIGLQSFSLRPETAVLIGCISQVGGQVVIEWNPGFARYQLQQTTALGQPWQDVGAPTTALSVTNSVTASSTVFYRVIGLLE